MHLILTRVDPGGPGPAHGQTFSRSLGTYLGRVFGTWARRTDAAGRQRVMAIASGGGHWVQLRRLAPAFEGSDLVYVTTEPSHRTTVGEARFRVVPDSSRWQRWRVVWCALVISWVLIKERPDAIVTTGAAPGYIAIRLGKYVGARTVWVDSIANADELSMSGEMARRHVDLWLTQWEHLARPDGPHFFGSVLGTNSEEFRE